MLTFLFLGFTAYAQPTLTGNAFADFETFPDVKKQLTCQTIRQRAELQFARMLLSYLVLTLLIYTFILIKLLIDLLLDWICKV